MKNYVKFSDGYVEFLDGHKEEILSSGSDGGAHTIQTKSGIYRFWNDGRREKLVIREGGSVVWVDAVDEIRRIWPGDLKAYPICFKVGDSILKGEIQLKSEKDIAKVYGAMMASLEKEDDVFLHFYRITY